MLPMPLKAYLKFGNIYIFPLYFLSSGQFHFTAIFYHLDNFISLLFFMIWTVSFHCYFISSGQFHFTAIFLSSGLFHFTAIFYHLDSFISLHFVKHFHLFFLFFFLPPFFCLHYSLWCCLATSVGPQKGDGGVYAQRAKTYRIGSIRWFEFPNAGEGTSMMAQRSWSFRSVLAR